MFDSALILLFVFTTITTTTATGIFCLRNNESYVTKKFTKYSQNFQTYLKTFDSAALNILIFIVNTKKIKKYLYFKTSKRMNKRMFIK